MTNMEDIISVSNETFTVECSDCCGTGEVESGMDCTNESEQYSECHVCHGRGEVKFFCDGSAL